VLHGARPNPTRHAAAAALALSCALALAALGCPEHIPAYALVSDDGSSTADAGEDAGTTDASDEGGTDGEARETSSEAAAESVDAGKERG
jgi:hypothetical protein